MTGALPESSCEWTARPPSGICTASSASSAGGPTSSRTGRWPSGPCPTCTPTRTVWRRREAATPRLQRRLPDRHGGASQDPITSTCHPPSRRADVRQGRKEGAEEEKEERKEEEGRNVRRSKERRRQRSRD